MVGRGPISAREMGSRVASLWNPIFWYTVYNGILDFVLAENVVAEMFWLKTENDKKLNRKQMESKTNKDITL